MEGHARFRLSFGSVFNLLMMYYYDKQTVTRPNEVLSFTLPNNYTLLFEFTLEQG